MISLAQVHVDPYQKGQDTAPASTINPTSLGHSPPTTSHPLSSLTSMSDLFDLVGSVPLANTSGKELAFLLALFEKYSHTVLYGIFVIVCTGRMWILLMLRYD